MSFEGTNSVGTEPRPAGGLAAWTGSKFALPLLGGILALAGSYGVATEGTAHAVVLPTWRPVSDIGAGTARAAVVKANYYQPKTDLGRRLLALREAAITKGMQLVPASRIVSDLEAFRA